MAVQNTTSRLTPQTLTAARSGGAGIPAPYSQWNADVQAASKKYGVPASLIFAVMSRETGGRNIRGDGGHGRGLMQIDDRSHGAWLASHNGGMDPKSNIDYGTSILAANLKQFHGNEKAALAAYNAGAGAVQSALRNGRDPDSVTTGHNYGSDVLNRQKQFKAADGAGAKSDTGATGHGGKTDHTGKSHTGHTGSKDHTGSKSHTGGTSSTGHSSKDTFASNMKKTLDGMEKVIDQGIDAQTKTREAQAKQSIESAGAKTEAAAKDQLHQALAGLENNPLLGGLAKAIEQLAGSLIHSAVQQSNAAKEKQADAGIEKDAKAQKNEVHQSVQNAEKALDQLSGQDKGTKAKGGKTHEKGGHSTGGAHEKGGKTGGAHEKGGKTGGAHEKGGKTGGTKSTGGTSATDGHSNNAKVEKLLNEARSHLGFHEGPGNSNPFSHALGRPSEAWCADFVSYCAKKAGLNSVNTASAQGVQDQLAAKGKWKGQHNPRPGDAVTFNWSGSKGWADHVGIVEKVFQKGGKTYIQTIEGNSSDSVARRTYPADAAVIKGFGSLV